MKLKLISKRIPKKELPVVTRVLRNLQSEFSVITPVIVVEHAEPKKSPLHKYFEWDNSKAAQEYRLWQARELILSVHVIDTGVENPQPVRAFVNVSPEEEGGDDFITGRGYVYTPTIRCRQNYQDQVLNYARQQLILWRRKFGGFKEFFGVVKEIDKL